MIFSERTMPSSIIRKKNNTGGVVTLEMNITNGCLSIYAAMVRGHTINS